MRDFERCPVEIGMDAGEEPVRCDLENYHDGPHVILRLQVSMSGGNVPLAYATVIVENNG